MKLSRVLHVYWPVLLFVSMATVGWFYDPAQLDVLLPFSWDPSRIVYDAIYWFDGFVEAHG